MNANAEQRLRIVTKRGVRPELFVANSNRSLVDRNPLRSTPRRVGGLLTNTVGSLIHRLTWPLDADAFEHGGRFSVRVPAEWSHTASALSALTVFLKVEASGVSASRWFIEIQMSNLWNEIRFSKDE